MSKTITLILTIITLLALAVYGWVMNVVAIIGMLDGEITGELIIRCVGVVVGPLGVIMGYIS